MATGIPSGVTTMSISSWTRVKLLSSTIIANTDVPAETFPERGRTALVATMPVPASPSGGQSGDAGRELARRVEQLRSLDREGPGRPARGKDAGEDLPELPAKLERRDQGVELTHPQRRPSQPVRGSTGNIPEASPTPTLCSPVSRQWT